MGDKGGWLVFGLLFGDFVVFLCFFVFLCEVSEDTLVVDYFTVCVGVLRAGAPVADAAGVITLFVGAADSLAATFVVSSAGHLILYGMGAARI